MVSTTCVQSERMLVLFRVNQWAIKIKAVSFLHLTFPAPAESPPASKGAQARTPMSQTHWPELGKRPHPISGTSRQYERPVGERRWDLMASSGVEGGGEGRNERLHLISLPFEDESPQSRSPNHRDIEQRDD